MLFLWTSHSGQIGIKGCHFCRDEGISENTFRHVCYLQDSYNIESGKLVGIIFRDSVPQDL